MKNDGKASPPSAASTDTVRGQTVPAAAGRCRRRPPTAAGPAGERPDPRASRPALGRAHRAAPAAAPGLRAAHHSLRHASMALLRRRSNPEGRMSLGDHLRELRNRLIVAHLAIALGGVVGWLAYDWLLTTLSEPLLALSRRRGGGLVQLNFAGVTTAFSLKLKVALFVGVLIASPVWLYQVWAFIVPGLTRREKRTAMAFVAAAVPLFLGGCYLATWALPKAVRGAARVHPARRREPAERQRLPRLRHPVHPRLRPGLPAAGLPRHAQRRPRAAGAGRCSRAGGWRSC